MATNSIIYQLYEKSKEYLPETTDGEWSAVFISGEYSHVRNDVPDTDDFSAFDETDLGYEPTATIRKQVAWLRRRANRSVVSQLGSHMLVSTTSNARGRSWCAN